MKLYNTLNRKIEELTPLKKNKVSFYSCGPTVYDKPTIGNWASFIRYDILARALRADGYSLDWVMNITDVGHLISDADEGEDKLEKGARREGKTAWEIAEYYSKYFMDGLDYFNISIPKKRIIRATDFIKEQIKLVQTLEKKGHTYQIEDGIYFASTTFAGYGKMARLDIAGLQKGFRVEPGGKKHVTDFALWKFSPKGKKRDMEWESPWGKGFPGWHLECSAIILKSLGESIDIHAGGIEHIPIHHTNEIAQSESATGKKLANFWVHNNHLKVDGDKISKSLGDGYTIEDLEDRGFSPKDFRMFVLLSNYRSEANFNWHQLKEARAKRIELQGLADLRFQPSSNTGNQHELSKLWEELVKALADNLDTSKLSGVISQLSSLLTDGLEYKLSAYNNFLKKLDDTLGFGLLTSSDITKEQKALIAERSEARVAGNWDKADEIRNRLLEQHISVKDLSDSAVWQRTV